MYKPDSEWQWAFTLITLFQTIISLALEAFIFGEFEVSLDNTARSTTQSKTIPTYLALFIFGFLYQLVLVYDALRLKNTIQVIGLCLYNLGLLIDSAVSINQVHDAVTWLQNANDIDPGRDLWSIIRPSMVAVPCILALGTILMCFTAWKLYEEFAWSIYKHISADLRLKRRYLTYQIYITLLKFDFFFFLGFTVQFLVVVIHTSDVEFYLTVIAVPITIALLFLAAYFTRRESTIGMVSIILLYFAALAYFLFKLVRMYDLDDRRRVEDYTPVRKSLTTFAVITVLLLIITIGVAIAVMRNFGTGLKPHIQRRKVADPEDKVFSSYGGSESGGAASHPMGPVQSRMTIE